MNPRHAAALALVGWYLMVPPLSKKGIDLGAPLSQWDQHNAFDQATVFEIARDDLVHCGEVLNNARQGTVQQACGFEGKTRREITDTKQEAIVAQIAFRFMKAKCVSTDDPRLKEK